MKRCPRCAFANEERFPTCVWCNAPLVEVRAEEEPGLSGTPEKPPPEWQANQRKRRRLLLRRESAALLVYVAAISGLALWLGLAFAPGVLLLYAATALGSGLAILCGVVGQFTASFLQGGLSLLLLFTFGSMYPFIFVMLLAHVMLPVLFWHWIVLIRDMSR